MATGFVSVKDGVEFSVIAPGGFCILGAIELSASSLGLELTITSACDGEHSGPTDPHKRGEAYDVRTRDLTAEQVDAVSEKLNAYLNPTRFTVIHESIGTDNEHIHVQVKKGTVYP